MTSPDGRSATSTSTNMSTDPANRQNKNSDLASGWFFRELDYPPVIEFSFDEEREVLEMLGSMSVAEVMALPVDDNDD